MRTKVHDLKTWPAPFAAVLLGTKTHEVRKDGRGVGGFGVGDMLVLREWDPKAEDYTSRVVVVMVTHVTHGGEWGVPDGLCVMSVTHASAADEAAAIDSLADAARKEGGE